MKTLFDLPEPVEPEQVRRKRRKTVEPAPPALVQPSLIPEGGTVPDLADRIEKRVTEFEDRGHVAPAWSKSERKGFDAFVGALMWALSGPVHLPLGTMGRGSTYEAIRDDHAGDVVMERLIMLMKFVRKERDWVEAQGDHVKQQEIFERMAAGFKDLSERLSNREVCMVMMDVSLEGPLDSWAYHEYRRAFAFSYGLDAHLKLMGPYFEVINDNACEMLRYDNSAVARRFPVLDKQELADFNARALAEFKRRQAEAKATHWPGTDADVVVMEEPTVVTTDHGSYWANGE